MEARNRPIKDWYQKLRVGEIKLPRFQRKEAWDRGRISSLMETIIGGLPLGRPSSWKLATKSSSSPDTWRRHQKLTPTSTSTSLTDSSDSRRCGGYSKTTTKARRTSSTSANSTPSPMTRFLIGRFTAGPGTSNRRQVRDTHFGAIHQKTPSTEE